MKLLTHSPCAAILFLLSQKTKAGPSTPENQGHRRPLSNVVFLCPSKTQAAFRRLDSVMAGCVGLPLKRRAGSLTGVENPMQSVTQYFSILRGGLSLFQGITAMFKSIKTPAKYSQSKYISLFNLIKRTPEGKRVICRNLTFSQASALVAEIPNAVVKFSRMGPAL